MESDVLFSRCDVLVVSHFDKTQIERKLPNRMWIEWNVNETGGETRCSHSCSDTHNIVNTFFGLKSYSVV